MKLYEINEQLGGLIDEETGEIADFEAFEMLQIERQEKLEGMAAAYKGIVAECEAIREEEKKLQGRRQSAERRAERLKEYLRRLLDGEKLKTAKVSVSYRKSKSVEVADGFLDWAKGCADELLVYPEPKPNKTAIKEAIENGRKIEFATIVENESMNIK